MHLLAENLSEIGHCMAGRNGRQEALLSLRDCAMCLVS